MGFDGYWFCRPMALTAGRRREDSYLPTHTGEGRTFPVRAKNCSPLEPELAYRRAEEAIAATAPETSWHRTIRYQVAPVSRSGQDDGSPDNPDAHDCTTVGAALGTRRNRSILVSPDRFQDPWISALGPAQEGEGDFDHGKNGRPSSARNHASATRSRRRIRGASCRWQKPLT